MKDWIEVYILNKEGIQISIVIPVYNVEKYVKKCLDSVLSQVNNQIEIIIIDDGSTDESSKICEDIIRDSIVEVKFFSQENVGLSATRNRGIDIASGNYIMFLDSDDELNSIAIKKLIEAIQVFPDVDLFYFDASTIDEIKSDAHPNRYNRKTKIDGFKEYDSQEYFNEYYVDTLIVSACLCLIRKEVLKDNDIRFDVGKLYEDNVFSLKTLLCSKKVCYLPYDLYIRRYRENSITTSRVLQKDIEDICFVLNNFLEMKDFILNMNSIITFNAYLTLIYKIYTWGKRMLLRTELNLNYMDRIRREIIEMVMKIPDKYKGSSYYVFAYYLAKEKKDSFIDLDELRENIIDCYWNIFKLLNNNENKRIAIYGRGKHTQILLEEYKHMMGNELQFSVYADSFESDGFEDNGKRIVNIKNIKEYADIVIISSYGFRLDMLKKCKEIQDIEIIDLYNIEKMNMFDERVFR